MYYVIKHVMSRQLALSSKAVDLARLKHTTTAKMHQPDPFDDMHCEELTPEAHRALNVAEIDVGSQGALPFPFG